MKTWAWAVPALLGLGLMFVSFDRLLKLDPEAPWSHGFLFIGHGEAGKPLDVGARISTRLRYLPASGSDQAMLTGIGATAPKIKDVLEARLRSRLVELPLDAMSPLAEALREGRLPEPGKDEVLAGSQAPNGEQLSMVGRTLKVVGVLQPSVGLFSDSYLVPQDKSLDEIFSRSDPAVQPVELVRLSAAEFSDRKILEQVMEAFPRESFIPLGPEVRSNSPGFAPLPVRAGAVSVRGDGTVDWPVPLAVRTGDVAGPGRTTPGARSPAAPALGGSRRLFWALRGGCPGDQSIADTEHGSDGGGSE